MRAIRVSRRYHQPQPVVPRNVVVSTCRIRFRNGHSNFVETAQIVFTDLIIFKRYIIIIGATCLRPAFASENADR